MIIPYYLDGAQVSPTNIVKDLGVTMDSLLKFHEHVNLTISKANRVLGLICKTFHRREPDMITRLAIQIIARVDQFSSIYMAIHYTVYGVPSIPQIMQQAIEGVQQRAIYQIDKQHIATLLS